MQVYCDKVAEVRITISQAHYICIIPSADKHVGVHVKLVRSIDNALPYLSTLEAGCLQ